MCRKIFLIVSLVLALCLGTSGAWGNGVVINCDDHTYVQQFTGSHADAVNSWKDVIGPDVPFQTFNATFNTSNNLLTIFTNWDPTKSYSTGVNGVPDFITADLFLNPVLNSTTHTVDSALAAINLGNLIGLNAGTVYYNPTFQTAYDIFHTFAVGYGGNFNTEDKSINPAPSNVFLVPVHALSGTSTGTADVTWAENPSDPPFNPLFSVAIDLSGITGLNLNDFSFLWGTSTCANDVITCKPIPLPPSLLLLGSGLLGLGVMGFRRKR